MYVLQLWDEYTGLIKTIEVNLDFRMRLRTQNPYGQTYAIIVGLVCGPYQRLNVSHQVPMALLTMTEAEITSKHQLWR